MDYVLGVDGGNSKTVALIARRDGAVVGVGRSACGDIYGAESAEIALTNITTAVRRALEMAALPAAALGSGVFSLAGADWPEDFTYLHTHLAHLAQEVRIVNDALGALRAGSPDGTGVVLVCGTGAAIGARSPAGRVWHSSFWQEPQGGEHLARKAIRAVYRAELDIDPPTALTAVVLRYFGQERVEDVLHLLTRRTAPRPPPALVAGLARQVLDTAQHGDPTAQRLVHEHGAALGDYALVAARQVGLGAARFPLVLAGGVLRHPFPLLAETIIARVQAAAPGATPPASHFEPTVGALFLAWEAAGIPVDERLLETLIPTLPSAAFFDT